MGVSSDAQAMSTTAVVGVGEHALPRRDRQRQALLAEPEHARLQPVRGVHQQPVPFGRIELGYLHPDPPASASHGHRSAGILHHQWPADAFVAARRAGPLDHLGPVEPRVRGELADQRLGHVDPAGGEVLRDDPGEPEPLVSARAPQQRDLEDAQRGLLGQPQPGADHQVREHRIAGCPPPPESLIQ
jgi:hypothetical protein